jgi:hypothetical protein
MLRAYGIALNLFIAEGIENLDQNAHSGYKLAVYFESVFHFGSKRIDAQNPDVRVKASKNGSQVGGPSPTDRLTNDRDVEAANPDRIEVSITREPRKFVARLPQHRLTREPNGIIVTNAQYLEDPIVIHFV